MNLLSDHRLQKSNHSSNSARSSEQQDTLTKDLGPNHPMNCFLYAMSSAQNLFSSQHSNEPVEYAICYLLYTLSLCVSPR